jgi:hypothetical protein
MKGGDHARAYQQSIGGYHAGLSRYGFTGQLLQVWKNGQFKGDYRKFHKVILKRMPPDQSPNLFRTGTVDPVFEKQKPFSI